VTQSKQDDTRDDTRDGTRDDTRELRRQAFRLITFSYALMIAIILGAAAVIVARILAPDCACPTAERK